MTGQSWCKSPVSKHSRIRLSSPFPVCASVDLEFRYDHSVYTYSLHIVYAEKAAEQYCHW